MKFVYERIVIRLRIIIDFINLLGFYKRWRG